MKLQLETDPAKKQVTVPHLGVTLRTILGACVKSSAVGTRPTWKVVFNNTVIGEVRLKTIREREGKKEASYAPA